MTTIKRTSAGICLVFSLMFTANPALAVTAQPAANFLNSMGCNGITSADWIPAAQYCGFHGFRANIGGSGLTLQICQAIGGKVCLFTACGGTVPDPAAVVAEAKKLDSAGVLRCVEGPNEPGDARWHITYQGQTMTNTDWTPLANYMRDLYAAVHADAQLQASGVFVASPSFIGLAGSNTGLQFSTIPTPKPAGVSLPAGTKFWDAYNAHYPHLWNGGQGGFTGGWANTANSLAYKEICVTMNGYIGHPLSELPSIPKIATEMGWNPEDMGYTETDAVVFGKSVMSEFLDAFANGYLFTYVYVLHDQDGVSQGQALFNEDKSPKESAVMLHNFTTILADTATDFTPGTLNFTIANLPTSCHTLLLQKSTGRFALAVWDERAPGAAAQNVTVNLGDSHTNVRVYDPVQGTTPTHNLGTVSSVTLAMTDHVQIIELDCNFDANLPYCNKDGGVYLDSVTVTLSALPGVTIRYTTDGTTPSAASAQYSTALTLKNDCVLKAIGINGAATSAVSATNFIILNHMAQPSANGLRYRYYEYSGSAWNSLAGHDLGALTPVRTGTVDSFQLGMQTRTDCFVVRYSGGIKIDTSGYYTFWDYSDAGSKLAIDGYEFLNNDGRHAFSTYIAESLFLSKGVYPISLDYFQDSANLGLAVYYKGPGFAKKKVPKAVLFNDPNSAVRQPISAHAPVMGTLRIAHAPGNRVSLAVSYAGAHELRILRADGRLVRALAGTKAAAYTFTRQELGVGVYFVNVISGKNKISRMLIVN